MLGCAWLQHLRINACHKQSAARITPQVSGGVPCLPTLSRSALLSALGSGRLLSTSRIAHVRHQDQSFPIIQRYHRASPQNGITGSVLIDFDRTGRSAFPLDSSREASFRGFLQPSFSSLPGLARAAVVQKRAGNWGGTVSFAGLRKWS